MLFFRRKQAPAPGPAAAGQQPFLKCSICTGEQLACLRSADGAVQEVMLVRSEKDLDAFRALCGLAPGSPIPKEY